MPYTQTDSYLKLDAFLIGLKLDDWYTNSTNCINAVVYTIDDNDYFTNNRTLYEKAGEGLIEPWLNLTGLIGGNLATSLPYCYQFYTSVLLVETTRFKSYDGWGDIMIAFLFNQMGNALAFQKSSKTSRSTKKPRTTRVSGWSMVIWSILFGISSNWKPDRAIQFVQCLTLTSILSPTATLLMLKCRSQ